MTTRAQGPAAGLQWLKRGINLGRHNPRAIFGGVALVALVALLPSVLQLVLQQLLGSGTVAVVVNLTLTMLTSLLLMPPMIGGYLRVIDASEHDRPAKATDVFAPFRSGPDMRRLVGYGLVMTALYLLVAGALVYLLSPGFPAWYLQVAQLAQSGSPVDPAAMPSLPDGLGPMLALGALLGVFLGSMYAIGFGQIALGGHGVGRAFGDGLSGTLRNLLPLLLLAVVALVLMVVVLLVTALIAAALGFAGGLVHPQLGAAIGTVVYMLMLLVVYVVMFGIMYHLWRDVAGDGSQTGPQQRPTPGQVEL